MNERREQQKRPVAVVVNDDVTQLNVLAGLLGIEDLDVRAFESAEAAMASMERDNPPDLIVTDLYMPGIDGRRFCRLLRSPEYGAFNHIPILIVSATFSGEDASRITRELGANAFLSMPVEAPGLIRTIHTLLRGEKTRHLSRALIVEESVTLAGGIARDFNNILASIIGYTELAMLRGVPEESQAGNCLEQVLKASHRARELIKQILIFTGQSDAEKRPVQVTPIIKEAVKLLRAATPTNIAIIRKISATSDVVLADPIQIHQVLMNLCTNATHAMREEGGVLKIMMTDMDADDPSEPLPAPRNNGRCLALSVSDTGHGIDPEHMDKIFDPFFTTKASGEGTGMGLSVVYGIVKDLNGDITVQSERSKGSTFSISLPICDEQLVSSLLPLPSLPTGNECVLLVDDEESLVNIGKDMLQYLGYKVVSAMGGMEALDAFRTLPEQFDLVITDLSMPAMSGFGLADELLKIRPDIPIILCTGLGQAIVEEARYRGIRQVLIKPFGMETYAKIIREVLGEGRNSYNSLDS